MDNSYIVGIDIGSTNIYGSIGKADMQGKLKLLAHSSVKSNGVKNGAIVDIEATSESIKACITELERMANIYITDVYISIPSGNCKLVSSKGFISISDDEEKINSRDVARVLNGAKIINLEENEVIIDIIPEKYLIDSYYEVKNPIGVKGSRLEVDAKVVVSDVIMVNAIYDCFKSININIKGTMISCESTSKILLSEEDEAENIALVDVGEGKTDIAVYKKGTLTYVKSLPLGGKNISADIAYCLKLHENESEMLKLSIENTYSQGEKVSALTKNNEKIMVDKDMIYEIIYARVEEILQFINNDVDAALKNEKINTVILYGGGISCFKYIEDVWKAVSDKNLYIVNKESINLENTLIINSLGIVKHVSNELKLNYVDYNEENILEDDNDNMDIEKDTTIIAKIKNFLSEYF